jgi:anti-sigma regulatory factor (Ser/Thr protein kinase)
MTVATVSTAPLQIPPARAAVKIARSWLSARLSRWPQSVIDDGKVIVSELATNAVIHVGLPGIFIHAYEREEGPIIEVRDSSRTPPKLSHPGNALEHGRGLIVVQYVAREWGYTLLPNGKSVWAILETKS